MELRVKIRDFGFESNPARNTKFFASEVTLGHYSTVTLVITGKNAKAEIVFSKLFYGAYVTIRPLPHYRIHE